MLKDTLILTQISTNISLNFWGAASYPLELDLDFSALYLAWSAYEWVIIFKLIRLYDVSKVTLGYPTSHLVGCDLQLVGGSHVPLIYLSCIAYFF